MRPTDSADHGDTFPMQARRVWLVALAGACALYVSTMAPGVLWGDSGEAQLHLLLPGWYVGGEIVRSHVLYYLVARCLLWLLPLKAAIAANLVSALAGAVTVANVACLLTTFCRHRVAVLAGAALLALSHSLWQLSCSAEVVTLSTALMTTELILLTKLARTRRLRYLAAMMFVNGLGVSNHNFALLMWPVYGLVAVGAWPAWSKQRSKVLLLAAGGLLVGMAPVLILCVDDLLARGSVSDTIQSFLVGHYSSKLSHVARWPTLLIRSVAMGALNFPTPLVLLAIPGVLRFHSRTRPVVRRVLLGATIVYLAFGAIYDVPDQHTFLVPGFVFVALLAGVGVDGVLSRETSKPGNVKTSKRRNVKTTRMRERSVVACVLALSFLAPIVYAIAPPLLTRYAADTSLLPQRHVPYRYRFTWFLRPWRIGQTGAKRFAHETLASLPKDAWLVVDATLCAPLNYVQVAESLRRDVRLDSWIARQAWFEPLDEKNVIAARQEKLAAGLLFCGSDRPKYQPPWLRDATYSLEPVGPVYRVSTAKLRLTVPPGRIGE